MVVPMEQWAGQPFQDKSADLSVVMLSDHNEKYSDRMERSYKAFAVTFELRFPFPLNFHPHFCETVILSNFYEIHDEKYSFLSFSTTRVKGIIWNQHISVNVHIA